MLHMVVHMKNENVYDYHLAPQRGSLIPMKQFEVSKKKIGLRTKHASFAINVKSIVEPRNKLVALQRNCGLLETNKADPVRRHYFSLGRSEILILGFRTYTVLY